MRLLHWFCPTDLVESVEGDLVEQYGLDVNLLGLRMARFRLLMNVLRFFRWGIISRNHFTMLDFRTALLLNHIKIAFRNYRRYFGYTLTNLAGLAVGLAVCFVIYSYTFQQLSYDSFHKDIDRLYRVNQTNIWSPEGGLMSSTAPPLAQEILDKMPQVDEVTRINTPGSYEVRYKNESEDLMIFREKNVFAADSNFFSFFEIPLIAGDPNKALNGTNQVVITEKTAAKYFGSGNALGKILIIGDQQLPVVVTGVAEDLPKNMHFSFDFLLSMASNPAVKNFNWSWIWTQVVTYVKLAPGTSGKKLSAQFSDVFDPQIRATFDRIGMDYDGFMKNKGNWKFALQPVQDIHLYSAEIGNRLGPVGDIKIVRILQIMAVLILIMAVINFVNLSTARANIRSKEIGVKKTMGATVYNLAGQFQTESILMTLMAAILSIPVIVLLSNLISTRIGIALSYSYVGSGGTLFIIGFILLGIGVVAGIYPSIYLTNLKPVSVMGKQHKPKDGNLGLRNVLVTTQFAISLALLSGGLLITRQLTYLTHKDLGFDRENVLILNNAEQLNDQLASFRSEVANMPGVLHASVAMDIPGSMNYEDIFMSEGSDIKLAISQIKIDPYFFPTLNLKLRSGRQFQIDNQGDVNHVIINETTARLFDWTPDEAINKKILYPDMKPDPVVIGVVKDFHFQSLYENISPLIFFHNDSPIFGDQRVVAVKYNQANAEKTISQVQSAWDRFGKQSPFEYTILDDKLNLLYDQERQLGAFVNLLSYLSIFIAILGLVGLVSYTVDRRRREIGIRKVLGASASSIFLLVNRQYFRLFVISLVLSIPFTWWAISTWLKDFAFHINISWITFAWSGIIVMSLCLFSVGLLIFRALIDSPILAIKDE
ncbi:MAG: ABC transporter permease [Saprospiraceae bacterium]|nr:ABC transporter permease [Saprospiraceae bacterium]